MWFFSKSSSTRQDPALTILFLFQAVFRKEIPFRGGAGERDLGRHLDHFGRSSSIPWRRHRPNRNEPDVGDLRHFRHFWRPLSSRIYHFESVGGDVIYGSRIFGLGLRSLADDLSHHSRIAVGHRLRHRAVRSKSRFGPSAARRRLDRWPQKLHGSRGLLFGLACG